MATELHTENEIHEVEEVHVTATEEHVSEEAHAGEAHLTHEAALFAEPVLHIGHFAVSNALVTSWAVVAILVLLAIALKTKIKEVPGKFQQLFELIIEGALDLMDQVTNDRKLSMKIFPVAITAFFFILVNNWLGIIPLGGLGLIETTDHGQAFIPFLRGGTADINTTLALAITAVIGANVFGVFSIGLWKTFNKYVNLKVLGSIFTKVKNEPTIVIVAPITFFVGLIEIVGEFAKIASLSFRLFGNVFAGEVLLASMAAIFAYAVPIPFLFLEIMVGVIQALIFSILLVVYFTISAQDHDHDEHEEHAHNEKIAHA